MNPQPPVTSMRIEASPSSGAEGALAVFPTWGERLADLQRRSAEINWMPWAIIALAAILRLLFLGMKPPHFDEGINGWFVDQMVKNGFYRYDPTNYHGPLHFYVLFLSETLLGRNIWALRLPVVFVSIACVYLAMKFEPFVGRNVSRLAALAMAVSPGFVFYGRYSIHEIWLQLFTMLFILGLIGLWRRGTSNYLWCLGMGLAGMVLTKETYIIHLGCAVVAALVTWFSHLLNRVPNSRPAPQTWSYLDLVLVVAAGAAAIVFFYSGTFFNWPGLKGLYVTFETWFKTGQNGNGHEKPAQYWLELIGRYELAVLFGLVFSLFCPFIKNISLRYLAVYGVGTLIAYSIVHYKTPWCVISFFWPLLFVFGAMLLIVPMRYRLATNISLGLVLFASLANSIRLNYFYSSAFEEPYVYVQTYPDIFKLTEPLLDLARRDPTNYQLTGHLIRGSTYPFPWILGDFTKVGYYENGNMPEKVDGDFLLVQQDKIEEVERKLHDSYYTTPLTIRPYQDTSKLFLSARVFQNWCSSRPKEFTLRPATP
jgi:uncharacterized protein (TIGR03663 family)